MPEHHDPRARLNELRRATTQRAENLVSSFDAERLDALPATPTCVDCVA
jgi:hypothetical protein